MSWKDKIDNSVYKIITGDGVEYRPMWRYDSSLSLEFNTAGFDYISKAGTFVDRKEVRSAKLPLTIAFDGENHLDIADDFLNSAKDRRFWIVQHPIYGEIKGHPVGIERIDDSLNVTSFNIDFWQTTLEGDFIIKVDPKTYIEDKNIAIAETTPNVDLTPVEQTKLRKLLEKVKNTNTSFIDHTFYPDFMQSFSYAMNSIDDVITTPSKGLKDINSLINFPSTLNQSFNIRFKMLGYIFNDAKNIFPSIDKNSKVLFSYLGGSIVGAICEAMVNPQDGDFNTINKINEAFNSLLNTYNEYLKITDESQSSFNDVRQEFAPEFEFMFSLNEIVQNTIYYLNSLVFDAKQERTIETIKDTNIFILTHQYFGLDKDDKNLNTFREINNIVNKKLFKIKKGTKIKYLV